VNADHNEGQAAFRRPPGSAGFPDLSVMVGSLRFKNPLLAASGCFGYGSELSGIVPTAAFGGIVTKTILEAPRPGNPPPRIVETPSGLINSIGLEGIGIERYIAEKIPLLADVDTVLVVSIGGHDVAEFARVAARLDTVSRVDAIEVNISCPNVDGGTDFSTDPRLAADTVRAVKRATGKPVWAKLTPGVTRIATIGLACQEAGADALSAVNTFTGMSVNVETGEAVLPRGMGGVSGPAIRPLALARVSELVRNVAIPVVGIGGISTARDVLEFLITGAAAIQLGTVLYVDPTTPIAVTRDLEDFLRRKNLASVRELIGTLRFPGGPGRA
jgi:dihydroorotate dehydrogenase (NAD+) catalytic subunit